MNEVVTILPTTLIWIEKNHINEVPAEDESLMLNNIDIPQSNEEVMRIYLENSYWKRYKSVIVQNVISDKKESREIKEEKLRTCKSKYKTPDEYYQFLVNNGYYVFSGSGVHFPEEITDKN